MVKKKFETDADAAPIEFSEVNQEDLSEDDLSQIRETIETTEEGNNEDNKKFVTGFRPNPPPRKSWWDRAEKRFDCGQKLVPVNWAGDNKRVCRVCSPGTDANTYFVKFYETRDESIINGCDYIDAPENASYEPYRDEYSKWKLKQEKAKLLAKTVPKTP